MPSIIEAPTKTRRDSRGMSEADAREYAEALETLEDGNLVKVDDSEMDTYEKAYARGERVRTAIRKFGLEPEGKKIQVIAFDTSKEEDEDEKFVAALRFRA